MVEKGSQEWREWAFSQREGEVPLPEALQIGKLTKKFRTRIWSFIGNSVESSIFYDSNTFPSHFYASDIGEYWENFHSSYNLNVLEKPHDEMENVAPGFLKIWLKGIVIKGKYHKLITLLEHMLRSPNIPKSLADDIESEIHKFSPYTVDRLGDPLCIFPVTSQEMKECVQQSFDKINQSGLKGAKFHLGDAARALNGNDFPGAIRESIHAAVAAAQEIDSQELEKLGLTLDSLKKKGIIKHPALKKAFLVLYGYSSNEKGIRHPLVGKNVANVGFSEAIFMYAACVAFVDYLLSKRKQMESE